MARRAGGVSPLMARLVLDWARHQGAYTPRSPGRLFLPVERVDDNRLGGMVGRRVGVAVDADGPALGQLVRLEDAVGLPVQRAQHTGRRRLQPGVRLLLVNSST